MWCGRVPVFRQSIPLSEAENWENSLTCPSAWQIYSFKFFNVGFDEAGHFQLAETALLVLLLQLVFFMC
jgi:hypothetical protein